MLEELLKSEMTRLSVEITDKEDQLAEEMAAGCGALLECKGATGNGNCGTQPGN